MRIHRPHRIVLSLVAVAAFAGPLAGVAQAAAPAPLPSIAPSGTQPQGTQLNLTQGTWDPAETGITDTWEQCDSGGANCSPITTATGNSYRIPADSTNLGKEIQVSETGTNPDTTTTTVTSNAVTVLPAPANKVAPVISGTPLQGNNLTTTDGTWDNGPSFTYQWEDCSGATCTAIASATNSTYTVAATDAGFQIKVVVKGTNADGTASATSAPTAAATALPVNTVAPAISGTPLQGNILTTTDGTWTNSPSFTYQWEDCSGATCTAIASATNSTYTVAATDAGFQIEVVVTGTNAAGSTPAASVPTAAATGVPVIISGQPTITGTTWQGQTLTDLTHASWTNSPTGYNYRWQRCDATGANCTNIQGATNQSYVLAAADVGNTIFVQETAVNAAGPAAAAVPSAATPVITLPPPGVIAPPSISGTAQQGMTLTEKAARWSNSPTSITIQWYRCDSNGLTCTANGSGATYPLTADDRGALIQVAETASNASNVQVIAVSPYAGPVADPAGVVEPPILKAGSQPAISGTAQLGRVLTASRATFDGNPGQYDDRWMRCNASACQPIPGATDLTYSVTAADVGDSLAFAETATNSGGASPTTTSSRTSVITAPSTTTMQASSHAPYAGQALTLIATVSSPVGSIPPSGSVTFNRDGTAIPGCEGMTAQPGGASQTDVCQTSLNASTSNLTAVFTAAAGTFVTGSSSSPTTLMVGRAATSLTVSPSGHVSLGSRTTYTAVVHPPASSLTPSGRVTFTDAGKVIKGCRNRALTAKRATCSVKYLGIKAHRISARYTGDANFAPSASITSHVLVQPQSPKGFVTVYMNWTFGFGPHSTTIKALSASGISSGIGISLTCNGSGCPFKHHKLVVKARGKCAAGAKKKCAAPTSVDLTPIFGRAQLRVGTSFTVAITHSKWVGKYYRFTIRASHRPSIAESCLAVEGTRPGVGCRAS